jgi:hypothetical protein
MTLAVLLRFGSSCTNFAKPWRRDDSAVRAYVRPNADRPREGLEKCAETLRKAQERPRWLFCRNEESKIDSRVAFWQPARRIQNCFLIEKIAPGNHAPILEAKDTIRDFSANKNGDDDAKENSHRAFCSANCCISCASGSGLRTPPHASERPRGGLRAIAEQQCLCRTGWYCSGVVLLDKLRQWHDGVGTRWSLICEVSKKSSGIARTFLAQGLGTRRGALGFLSHRYFGVRQV